MSKLWKEIQSFKSPHTCTCDASSHIEKEREDAKVHKFLFGLDESRFSSIRSQIIDEDPLPDLNLAYSLVIRAEQRLLTMRLQNLNRMLLGSPSEQSLQPHTPHLQLHLQQTAAVIPTDSALIATGKDMRLRNFSCYMVTPNGTKNRVVTLLNLREVVEVATTHLLDVDVDAPTQLVLLQTPSPGIQ